MDPRTGVWLSVDPLGEEEPEYSSYVYCHNNPINNTDPDGCWVWAAVGAGLDYGLQVYDNYQSGKSGYDAWVGDVNFVSVGLSAINPTGKFAAAKTLAVEVAKATIEVTANKGVKLHTEANDIEKAVVNTVVSVGAAKLKNASSDKTLKQADKRVVNANNKVSTAERRLAKSPNSTNKASNLSNARSAAQQARNTQVRTKMLNSTIGKVNENAVQQTVNTANNRTQKAFEKK